MPSRSDERVPLEILTVAGLLADEHDLRVRRALAEDGLRRRLPEIATAAAGGGLAHDGKVARARDELLGARVPGQDFLRAVALPPLRPAAFFCAVVPPCFALPPEPDFLPP